MRKKGLLFKKPIADLCDQGGKKPPNTPQNYSSASPLVFLCGKTENFHVSLGSYCFYKKGKTGASSCCCLERIIITAENESHIFTAIYAPALNIELGSVIYFILD